MTRFLALIITLTFSSIGFADFDKGLACARQQEFPCALKEWVPLADQGDMVAQYNLGIMYANGQGVKQDLFEAFKYYKLAADQGKMNAQYNLGVMYANGQGVRQDKLEAKRWYGLACDNRSASGCKDYKILNEQGY